MATEFTNEGFNVGYRAGVLGERERIIALLEQPENREKWICATRNTVGTYNNTVEFLIALIKGEN